MKTKKTNFMRTSAVYPICCFILMVSFACFNAEAQQFTPPKHLAMGGTGVASIGSYQAALVNPATLVLAPQIEMGAFYQNYNAKKSNNSHIIRGVGFMDNGPVNVAVGAFNSYGIYNRDNGQKSFSEVFVMSLAESPNEVWSFGVNLIYQRNQVSGQENSDEKNLDFGAMWAPYQELGFGLMLSGLIPQDDKKLPEAYARPSYIAMGATYYWMDEIEMRLDASYYTRGEGKNKFKTGLGVRTRLGEFFHLRLGMENNDSINENSYMGGFGFNGPRLKMDYAYKKVVNAGQGDLHSVDLRLSF